MNLKLIILLLFFEQRYLYIYIYVIHLKSLWFTKVLVEGKMSQWGIVRWVGASLSG